MRPGDFLAPVFAQYPLEVAAAQGVWLTNTRGERVLDLYGGHAVAALGYGHPAWTAALAHQAQLCQFQSNAVALAIRARAAERLVRFAQLPDMHVFFVNSGAEANENALRIALRTTGRAHVVAIEGAFHGRTAAAGAVTWAAQAKWYGFPRAPFNVSFLARGDTAAIRARVTRRTAAVIVEPVQGLAGAVDLGKEFLGALRRRCDAVGALLIFDEVQCGVGRTGQPFAANLHGIVPDLVTMGKPMGNGHPIAAIAARPEIFARFAQHKHYFNTYGGNSVSCAAALAVLHVIRTENLLENARCTGEYLKRGLSALAGRCSGIVEVRGVGLFVGVELHANPVSGLAGSAETKRVVNGMCRRGVLIGSTGRHGNVLKIRSPLTFKTQHADVLIEALEQTLTEKD